MVMNINTVLTIIMDMIMSNIKIGGKYVLYRAIESMYYNEKLIKGDVLHTNTLDEQKGEIVIENTLRIIHEYLQNSD
jgi:hypothetical protein